MEPMHERIGKKLKSIRTVRALSLDDAAALTGVSKPMLGQIERGQSVPTVTTLWKIATGLKVPLSSFLEEPRVEYAVAGASDDRVILGGRRKDAGVSAVSLRSGGAQRGDVLYRV